MQMEQDKWKSIQIFKKTLPVPRALMQIFIYYHDSVCVCVCVCIISPKLPTKD